MFFEYDPAATLAGTERLKERAQTLRQALLPLRTYVQHRTATLDPTSPYAQKAFEHLRELETAFRAVAEYHAAVEELARVHWPREAQARQHLVPLDPEADPAYRLGYVRGYQRGQAVSRQAHETVLSLYARHAALPAPPTSSPLVGRVRRFLSELSARYGAEPLQQAA